METRLNYYKQNVSAYVERVIEYEEVLAEYHKAVHIKDVKAPTKQEAVKPKTKVIPANLCKDHPNYGAKRAPRSEACSTCWSLYEKYNGQDAARRAREKLRRNQRVKKIQT